MTQVPQWLRLSEEVENALAAGSPIVALESTVIAHGLPRPRNLQVARQLEDDVRAAGAVPGTVALIDGQPRIGLTADELERVGTEDEIAKLSTREIPLAIAGRATGATTVAATAHLASRAGIPTFATGGIGGVHRGSPPDISADLTELRRTRTIVVCAGAKSVLDVPATRELLETLGVLVLGWRTDRFPAFYVEASPVDVDARVDAAATVAGIWRAHRAVQASGSILLCVPIPAEHALPTVLVDEAISDALQAATRSGISGKAITPFLLSQIAKHTAGASLEANIALLRNNAKVAAEVAAALRGKGGEG